MNTDYLLNSANIIKSDLKKAVYITPNSVIRFTEKNILIANPPFNGKG